MTTQINNNNKTIL